MGLTLARIYLSLCLMYINSLNFSFCTLYWLYWAQFLILVHLSHYIIIFCPIIIGAPFYKS